MTNLTNHFNSITIRLKMLHLYLSKNFEGSLIHISPKETEKYHRNLEYYLFECSLGLYDPECEVSGELEASLSGGELGAPLSEIEEEDKKVFPLSLFVLFVSCNFCMSFTLTLAGFLKRLIFSAGKKKKKFEKGSYDEISN